MENITKQTHYRNKLTNVWKENGIDEDVEYAILTNEIYKTWSGMTSSEYKDYKGIKKESLRDNMIDIEIVLTDLAEISTREIANVEKPQGLKANKMVAKKGGTISKNAKEELENNIGKKVITKSNNKRNEKNLN